MWKLIVLMCLLGAGTFVAGCVDVKADASGLFGGSDAKDASAPPPDPASDPRGIADLRRENAQLRQTLAGLEKDREGWQSAIDRQKNEISALKRQREQIEKDRDRYRKALKREED